MNAYRQSVDPLEALGDATRRAIVESLRGGERTVGELAGSLPVSRPAVSQHLAVLRAAGLVLDRPQGTRRWYRLDPIGLVRLQERLEALWGLEAEPAAASAPPRAIEASNAPAAGREAAAREAPAEMAGGDVPQARPTEPAGKGERKKRKKKGGRK